MKASFIHSRHFLTLLLALGLGAAAGAQVNSGSNGSDGAFNPTTNIVINMADHTNGIYQYSSVNVPGGVTVRFIPNANNSPVTWLVQSNVVINGTVDVSGQSANNSPTGVAGGSGGWQGGSGGSIPSSGRGPGGGIAGTNYGGHGLFNYGNSFLIPLLGGSGGGGCSTSVVGSLGGGGGGGALLIAASGYVELNGTLTAAGGDGAGGYAWWVPAFQGGAGGSGGGIRIATQDFRGGGTINAAGGSNGSGDGSGRIRIDSLQNSFGGTFFGAVVSQGFQPIIIPSAGQGVQLNIASVGGVSVSTSPSGQFLTPDAIISGQQLNPIPIVVSCSNLPLNTPVTVTVRPANGSPVSAVGLNNTGTLASSTATVSLSMPRGGGIIYATAATGN